MVEHNLLGCQHFCCCFLLSVAWSEAARALASWALLYKRGERCCRWSLNTRDSPISAVPSNDASAFLAELAENAVTWLASNEIGSRVLNYSLGEAQQ